MPVPCLRLRRSRCGEQGIVHGGVLLTIGKGGKGVGFVPLPLPEPTPGRSVAWAR